MRDLLCVCVIYVYLMIHMYTTPFEPWAILSMLPLYPICTCQPVCIIVTRTPETYEQIIVSQLCIKKGVAMVRIIHCCYFIIANDNYLQTEIYVTCLTHNHLIQFTINHIIYTTY